MEPIDFKLELDENAQAYHDHLVKQLQQDPQVLDFLKKNNLDAQILEQRSGVFDRWLKTIKQCQSCQGLNFCVSKVKGNACHLSVDDQNFINEEYIPCRYQRLLNDQLSHKENFTFSHMQNQDYLVSFEALSPTLAQESKAYLVAYAQAVASINMPHGCLFYGQPGTGKSTLMMALANALAKQGKRIVYVRVPLLISELKENLKDNEFYQKTLTRMRLADVLFLDDFGSESVSRWSRDDILFPVLDERMNNHRKTYFASNVNISELEAIYSVFEGSALGGVAAKRLIDRVTTLAQTVELTGVSRRQSPSASQL